MKSISLTLLSIFALAVSGCQSERMVIEHRDIVSSLPPNSVLRVPHKIPFLDEDKIPQEVLNAVIKYQKIMETGRFRDLADLKLMGQKVDAASHNVIFNDLMSEECIYGPSLAILDRVFYGPNIDNGTYLGDHWYFSFILIPSRNGRKDSSLQFSRKGENDPYELSISQ